MENYELQLKPFEEKDGYKYKILQITDFTLHATEKRTTKAIARKIKQTIEHGKPSRLYGLKTRELMEGCDLAMFINDLVKKDPDFVKMIQEEEKKGYKILLALPKDGIPIMPGSDTVEFLRSKKGQKIINGIDKQKK